MEIRPFRRALPALLVAAALETTRGELGAEVPILIAAACLAGLAALASALLGGTALLLTSPLGRPALRAALAGAAALLPPLYMTFHDVKYDLLGPFPSSWLVQGARLGVLAFALLLGAAGAALAAWRPGAATLLGAAALLAATAGAVGAALPGAAGGPAVLLVTIDTLRADHLGAYGQPLPLSPHADRLARRAALHEEAFCAIPITTPSHATILTGRYPSQHAVRGQAYSMSREIPTVTEALRAGGLRTGAYVAAFPLDSKFGLARGFEVYDDELWGTTSLERLSGVRLARLVMPIPQIERRAPEVNARAAAFLSRHGAERFFLWAHYFDPHGPYDPAEPSRTFFLDRCRDDLPAEPPADATAAAALRDALAWSLASRAGDVATARLAYAAEVAEADRALGALLLRTARARDGGALHVGLLADHGESLTEHGAYFRHGEDLYDPSLRIPLLWSAPGVAPSLVADVTETTQVAGMIAAAAGVAFPEGSRVAAGAVLAESTSAAVHYRPRKVVAARTAGYKIVRGVEDGRVELYDLGQDPAERADASGRMPDAAADLGLLLDAYPRAGDPAAIVEDRETIEKLKSLGYLQP